MKKLIYLVLFAVAALSLSGCGLVSGTVFVSQEVEGRIESSSSDNGPLDDSFGHAIVDFTDNSDWQDYEIEGVEDGCIAMDAWNQLATVASGEVWITTDTTEAAIAAINSVSDIQAAGGFRVFNGIALPAGPHDPDLDPPTKHFTCAETLALLENVDQLVGVLQTGYFVAWGVGNEDSYSFTFDGIIFGIHLTGSL
jgi:hypothetical protein